MALTREELKKKVQEAVRSSLQSFKTTIRKSAGDAGDTTEKRPFSIAKYLRGYSKGNWQEADQERTIFKALNEGVATAGGVLVPPEYSDEVIAMLKAKAVIRKLGAQIVPMKGDTLIVRRQTGASTGYWVGESQPKTESEQTFGTLQLILKEVCGLVKVSNNLIEDASPAVDTIVKRDLVEQLQLAEDLAYIRGTGGLQPLGIYNDPSVGSTTLGAGNGAIPSFDDLLDAMYAIESNNGTFSGWLIHPRTKNSLRKLKDGQGNYLYTAGDAVKGIPDTLWGLPVAATTQIPTTLTFGTSGATCSFIILGEWSELMIGQKVGAIRIAVSDTAGDAFQYDETWFRATLRVDCAVRQPSSFHILKGIKP